MAQKPFPLAPFVIIGCAAVLLITISAFFAAQGGGGAGGLKKLTTQEIRSIRLNQSMNQFVAERGGVIRSGCVFRHVDDVTWGDINFCWESPEAAHASSVNVNPARVGPTGNKPLPESALKRAEVVFGKQLIKQSTGGYHYHNQGASFYLNNSVGISVKESPGWEKRVDVLWQVLRHVMLGDPFQVGPAERAALNVGYGLAELAKIDIKIPVKQAEAEIKRAYPGVAADGPRFDVGLEHPWFLAATIYWNNTLEGGMESIVLRYHAGADYQPFQRRLESCITPVIGKPQVTIIDPLRDTKNYFWSVKNKPNVTVSHQSLVFRWRANELDLKQHRAVLQAIASCEP